MPWRTSHATRRGRAWAGRSPACGSSSAGRCASASALASRPARRRARLSLRLRPAGAFTSRIACAWRAAGRQHAHDGIHQPVTRRECDADGRAGNGTSDCGCQCGQHRPASPSHCRRAADAAGAYHKRDGRAGHANGVAEGQRSHHHVRGHNFRLHHLRQCRQQRAAGHCCTCHLEPPDREQGRSVKACKPGAHVQPVHARQ